MNKETIGMYVRTKKGKIFKVDGDLIYLNNAKTILYRLITRIPHDTISYEVVKASFDIIDILEVGDYVNGYKIKEINNNLNEHKGKCNGLDTELWYVDENDEFKEIVLLENNIKTIVTHEQMEQMSYKLGE